MKNRIVRRRRQVDLEQAERLYADGFSLREISTILDGPSPAVLSVRLKEAGVMIWGHRPRFRVSGEQLVALRDEGLSWAEVGRRVGMSGPGVRRRYVALAGPPPPAVRRRPWPTDEHLLEVLSWGANMSQAASMLGISPATVSKRLRRIKQASEKDG